MSLYLIKVSLSLPYNLQDNVQGGDRMKVYAYVRVSTKEQNIDRQIAALEPYEVPKNHIYCDYQSGKDFDRPAYKKLMRRLKAGDLLIIKSIDRLGRNYEDILTQWQHITKEIKADILVLDMELLDTRSKDNGLTGTLIADLVLQIFAYVAQTEREFIKQRQAEGIAAAKAKGIQFGRKKLDIPEGFEDCFRRWEAGQLSTRKGASELGVSHTTFHRWCVERKQNMEQSVSEGRLKGTNRKA